VTVRLTMKTGPAIEPVTVADFMAFARVDIDPGDGLMASLIAAARRRVERETGLALITQTWVATMDRWPADPAPDYKRGLVGGYDGGLARDLWWDGMREGSIAQVFGGMGIITVPKRPWQSMVEMRVRQLDATFVTVASSTYYVSVDGRPAMGRIARLQGNVWPVVYAPLGGIEVEFLCGFGDTASTVPDDLILAIKMLASHWHENRELMTDGRFGSTPNLYAEIVRPWTSRRLT